MLNSFLNSSNVFGEVFWVFYIASCYLKTVKVWLLCQCECLPFISLCCLIGFLNIYILLEFDFPTSSITPSAHPIKCPHQCLSPSHPMSFPTSPSTTPCPFPELEESLVFCHPHWYFLFIFSPFPFNLFHYFLYSLYEWDHTMFVLLRLAYSLSKIPSSSTHVLKQMGICCF